MDPRRVFLTLHFAFFLDYNIATDNFFHLSGEFNTTNKIGRLSHNPFDVLNSTPGDPPAHFSEPDFQLQKTGASNSTQQATGKNTIFIQV